MENKKRFTDLDPAFPSSEVNVTALYTTFCYYYSPDFVFAGEYHKPWELVYVIFGEVVVKTDDYTVILKAGDVFLHKPEEFHVHEANNVACNACFISFDCDCPRLYEIAGQILHTTPNIQTLIQQITDEGFIFLAGKNSAPPLLKNEIPQFACGQVLKNTLELLLISLIRQKDSKIDANLSATSRNEKSLSQSIKLFLNQHIYQKLSLKEIADGLGYSVSHTCYSFKKYVGVSIIQYFIELRINEAKKLIAEGKMSLGEISDSLSFDTIQYFSAQFKKTVGVSPSQYAAIIKNK